MPDPALTSGDPLGLDDTHTAPPPPPKEEEPQTGWRGLLERRKGLVAVLVAVFAGWKALRWLVAAVWSFRGFDEVGPFLWDHRVVLVLALVALMTAAFLAARFVIPRVTRRA